MTKVISHPVRSKVFDVPLPFPPLVDAGVDVRLSGDRRCLVAGIEALQEMMADDAAAVCGHDTAAVGNAKATVGASP